MLAFWKRTAPIFALLTFLSVISCAAAQDVQQSGSVTANHIPYWVTNGVVGDGGSSADSPITSIGVTSNSGAGICVNSDRITAPGYNSLCLGAQTNGPGTISLQNFGTASPQNLQFVINGTAVTIPTGGQMFLFGSGAFTASHIPCFLNSSGVIQDCGLSVSAGAIVGGQWQGTPVAIGFGGTGATTAAGARTALGLGTMSTQNANAVAITGGTITGMSAPIAASDVANKSYVDSTAQGLIIQPQSRLATAAVLPNSPTYSNGTLGAGATLTAGSNTTLTVDGVAVNLNDVVLVKNQAAAAQNGIYTLTQLGSGSTPWILTRATYFDVAAQMLKGSYTFITAGSANVNSSWVLQTSVTTVGTDSLVFNQFSVTASGVTSIGGQTGVITCGVGIVCSGNSIAPDYTTNNTWSGGNTFSGGTTLTLPVGGTGISDPKAGRFLPLLVGVVSGTSCSSTTPFTCMQFCVYKGNQVMVAGVLQTIPPGQCVGQTGGVMGAYNQACIENASFITTCGQLLSPNTLYYAYVGIVSGTLTMIWSTNTHSPSLGGSVTTYGNEIMTGDASRSLIGMCHTDGTGKFVGAGNRQDCASWFNRIYDGLAVGISGTFSAAAYTGFGPCSLAGFSGCLTWVQWSDDVPTISATCVFSQNSGSFLTVTGGIGVSATSSAATVPAATSAITVDNGNLLRQIAVDQSGAIGTEGFVIGNFLGLSNGSAVVSTSACQISIPSRISS